MDDTPAFWRFTLALLIDGALISIPAVGAAVLVADTPNVAWPVAVVGGIAMTPLAVGVLWGVATVISLLQHLVVFPALGGTVGGRLAGITWVRGANAAPVPTRLLRGLLAPLFGMLLLVGPLYALWVSPNHRGPADGLSGIRLRRRGTS